MAIAFVASGTAFTATASGTTFTLNKPAGVATGNIMLAVVAFCANGAQRTVPAPTGWTIVNTAYKDNGGADQIQVIVMSKMAAAADPATWTLTASASVTFRTASVTAYSGVQGVGASGIATAGTTTSFATASVAVAVANSWRVVAGAYVSGSASYTISSNESVRRVLATAEDSGAVQAALWDSNGTAVAVGSTSRTVSRSANWAAAAAVILILPPFTGTPASGVMANTLTGVHVDAAGEIHDNAIADIDLGGVTVAFTGAGQPIVGSGTFTVQLGGVGVALTGATVATGVMDTLLPIDFDFVGETRAFGIRVILVEFDKSRIIKVEPRAVED